MDQQMRMQYIGAVSLLARLTARRYIMDQLDIDDRDSIERAVKDCAALFPDSMQAIRVGAGWSLEPKFVGPIG
jgi:hypothetical protein